MDQQQWQEFLSGEGAIWEGNQAHFPLSSVNGEAELHLIDLSPLGAVAINGADSQKFLQGQLTCDLVALPDEHATLGAHCNPKGRMISAFYALKLAHDEFLLALPRDLADTAREALAKYAVFFKTELKDASDDHRWIGLTGRDATGAATHLLSLPALTAGAAIPFDHNGHRSVAHALSDTQVALLVPAQQAADLWQQLTRNIERGGYNLWQQRLIEAGIPQLHRQTSEVFIPQMLNLHLLGGVSFKKGCYTGQEIVARMQFRGAAKKRMYRLRTTSGDIPAPGQDIYGEGERSIGNLVQACRDKNSMELLAVLAMAKVAAGEQPRLADGRLLELLELPYDADADPLA